MSLDAEAEALKTRLAAATKAPVFDQDEAQAAASSLPANYTVIYLGRRFGGETRFDGTRGTALRRLSTRVSAKSVTNARLIEDRIHAEFAYSEVSYEAGGGVYDYEGGYWTALTDWTFTSV